MLRDNLNRIKREPSLLLIELAWRWLFGAVTIAMLAFAAVQLRRALVVSPDEQARLASMAPDVMVDALAVITARVFPLLARLAASIVPLLFLLWVATASVGRALVLSRLIGPRPSHPRWSAFVALHALRALSVIGLAAAYVACTSLASLVSSPENPNYLLGALLFLILFAASVAAWMWVHWVLSLGAIFPVSAQTGIIASVQSALQLVRGRRRELTRIASANGTARTVVAVVFTFAGLLPLPLYVVSPRVLTFVEIVIALSYCVASDFLLLGRLAAYVEVATSRVESP